MQPQKLTTATVRKNNNSIISNLRTSHIAIIVMAIWLVMSCNTDTIYHHFSHIPEEGWDKRDTFYFKIDTILVEGNYTATLCTRTDATYPYRNLSLKTILTVMPSNTTTTRSTDFDITNQEGAHDRKGITLHNHEREISTIHLQPGDSLNVKVAHNMRKETMPGITDIGIKVTRK